MSFDAQVKANRERWLVSGEAAQRALAKIAANSRPGAVITLDADEYEAMRKGLLVRMPVEYEGEAL